MSRRGSEHAVGRRDSSRPTTLVVATGLMVLVGACGGNSGAHGTSISASDVLAALRKTASTGTILVTKTCSGPVGVASPTTAASQAVNCGAGTGVINYAGPIGPPAQDFTELATAGQTVRLIVAGSKAWQCQSGSASLGPGTTCTVSAATDGTYEDPFSYVPGSHLSVVGSAVIDGIPVTVVQGASDSRGLIHGTVAIGNDGLVHQVSFTDPKSDGSPEVTTTWTFTKFSVTTPITAPPASVQTAPFPSLG